MGLLNLADRVKQFVSGEIANDKKNEAFDQIQQATGVPIDEKQRMAIIKANVDPNLLLAGFSIKRIKDAAGSGRAADIINQSQLPDGMKQLQEEYPMGVKATQGGVSIDVPSLVLEEKKAKLEVETAAKKTTATKTAERDLAKKELNKEIEDFFLVDNLVPRTDGGFLDRIIQGSTNVATGMNQSSSEGFALATHDGIRKRLRVRLVRAAGDVGNINIVEQQAAEQIIPTKWDSKGTAELKKAYLREATKALNDNNPSEVKKILARFAETEAFNGPKGKAAEKFKKQYKVGEIKCFCGFTKICFFKLCSTF
jgi:hypothetical protein